jgi:hypothetical protein
MLRVLAQKPLKERKCHARLTREYTDGGANICAENEIDTAVTTVEKYLDPIKDTRHTGGARACVPVAQRPAPLPECGIVLLA